MTALSTVLCLWVLLASQHAAGAPTRSKRAIYDYYNMFDFRNLTQYVGVPAVQTTIDGAANAGVTSSYFDTSAWTSYWAIQTFSITSQPVYMQYSKSNVYIEANTDNSTIAATHLTLRTARQAGFQSAAEIDSVSSNFKYISLYMFARTTGAPGAVTAMFTYQDSTQEADLEILTSGPTNTVHFTDQPSTTQTLVLPDGLVWTDWQLYRYDWSANASTWYINGRQVCSFSTDVPTAPSTVIFNAWGYGNSWSGNMSEGDAAFLQIQYIELYSSNSEIPH